MLKTLKISGLRGFATAQTLNFAIPNGKEGGGLTIIVGANNGGKSTVVEALRAVSQPHTQLPSFSKAKRNTNVGGRVEILAETVRGKRTLKTVARGGSEMEDEGDLNSKVFVLTSRRQFAPHFGKAKQNRDNYLHSHLLGAIREPIGGVFYQRLFTAFEKQDEFNAVLAKIVVPAPIWRIDQDDAGNHFIEISSGAHTHTSEGIGEGLLSLFFIVDSLYDSSPNDVIVIDEPEISLHPALQRRLMRVLQEHAKDRQIVISTHSPYFTDFSALINGGTLARVFKSGDSCHIMRLTDGTKERLAGLLKDGNNPHVLGLNAREVFFLEDGLILVEGQEDVVFYPEVCRQVGVELEGAFFGWGVGGADKMNLVCSLLKELGFERVAGILDKNKADNKITLDANFPEYRFFVLPMDDVRSKPKVDEKAEVKGVLLKGEVEKSVKMQSSRCFKK